MFGDPQRCRFTAVRREIPNYVTALSSQAGNRHTVVQIYEGIDSTACMVREHKDSTPQVSPPGQQLPMQILTSYFHHFTETVQGFDKKTYFHQGNDLEERDVF
ncbi:hypothetical protein TNCV_5056121 [Trichonephila clavipes]|nr:hypothetical protein TNCV_5056121 [Trichonephila clavipes]